MQLDVITTLLVAATATAPAGAYDLTTLKTLKYELEISQTDHSKDYTLQRYITEVSADFSSYCNGRVFQVETVQDLIYPPRDAYPYQVPGGAGRLQLSRWPLISPPVTLLASADTASGNVLPFASTTGVVAGQPAAHASIVAGTVVTAVASTSVTLSAPIAADVPSGASVAFGIDVRITDPIGVVTLLVAGTDYQVDAKAGQLIKLNQYTGYPTDWDPVLTTASYQAGFATIPPDLAGTALREITRRNASRGRDPMLKRRDQPGALGTEEYWVGSIPGVRGAFTEEVTAVLDRYRVPVAV